MAQGNSRLKYSLFELLLGGFTVSLCKQNIQTLPSNLQLPCIDSDKNKNRRKTGTDPEEKNKRKKVRRGGVGSEVSFPLCSEGFSHFGAVLQSTISCNLLFYFIFSFIDQNQTK